MREKDVVNVLNVKTLIVLLLNFKSLLGNGNHLGIKLSYQIQKKPKGIAEAFIIGEKFISNSNCVLILGDNIFYGQGFSKKLFSAKSKKNGATIFSYPVDNPERYGVVELDKKEFAKLFGEYLKAENILQNYDEFAGLKALQSLDTNDNKAVEAFKAKYYLNDDDIKKMTDIEMPSERAVQDYRSTYNDTREWLRREKQGQDKDKSTVDWDDVVFEVDLLKSQEINLDYILELIFEHNKKNKSKEGLINEVRRMIRGSLGNRAKESLVVDFINQTNLDEINDKASIIDAFFKFAQAEQKREADAIIASEKLDEKAARRYIASSLKREYATENGTALNDALPKLSPLNPQYRTQKQTVFQKIAAFVEKFKGVGGQL